MNLADQKKTDKIVPVDIFNKNLFEKPKLIFKSIIPKTTLTQKSKLISFENKSKS
jgi:hypothetical protein